MPPDIIVLYKLTAFIRIQLLVLKIAELPTLAHFSLISCSPAFYRKSPTF